MSLTGRLIGPPLGSLVLRRAEVDGALVDVRVDDTTVTAIGPPGSLGGADREESAVAEAPSCRGCTTTTSISWPWRPP